MFSRTGLPAGDGDAATSFLPAAFSPARAAAGRGTARPRAGWRGPWAAVMTAVCGDDGITGSK
jgi:hypothetical protein